MMVERVRKASTLVPHLLCSEAGEAGWQALTWCVGLTLGSCCCAHVVGFSVDPHYSYFAILP